VEVTGESGALVAGATVMIYNASGEEIRHWITDRTGRARVRGSKQGLIDKEKWLGNWDKDSYVIRIIKSGYLTYESPLERNLADKLIPDNQAYGDKNFKINVRLLRRPKSKISNMQKTLLRGYAHNRPP